MVPDSGERPRGPRRLCAGVEPRALSFGAGPRTYTPYLLEIQLCSRRNGRQDKAHCTLRDFAETEKDARYIVGDDAGLHHATADARTSAAEEPVQDGQPLDEPGMCWRPACF